MDLFAQFPATMASGGTLSSEVDLGYGWRHAYLEVPTLTSNTQLHVQAAATQGGTYRRVYQAPVQSVTTAVPGVFAIASAITNGIVPIPSGFRYLKVEATATVDNGALFRFLVGE